MARGVSQESFFDVLIDRLVTDVKRDFEASLRVEEIGREARSISERDSIFDRPKKQAPPLDDLVSKMVGFRVRQSASAKRSPYQLNAPRKFDTGEIQTGIAPAARIKATPKFDTSAATFAYNVCLKSGAQFFAEDVIDGALTAEALKRERRRVLLTLHPDRLPEGDRVHAHHAFLTAAEAFSVLAESRSKSTAA